MFARDMWLLELLGCVLVGAGLIAGALFLLNRARRQHRSGEAGSPGNLPDAVGINVARVRIGGDVAGLLVVVGLVLAFMPVMWGWFLLVAICGLFVAVGLFLWHRFHPW